MTKDDAIRITLRMPEWLHDQLTDAASDNGWSLNKQIIEWLEAGRDADFRYRLLDVPREKWLEEIKEMRKEIEDHFADVEKTIILLNATRRVKKGAA